LCWYFTLNLRNRLIFKAADEEGALESADFLGKKRVIKKSWGYLSGKMSRNYSEQEEHKIKPHILRNLSKYTAIVVHCERGHRKRELSPLDSNGRVSPWFQGTFSTLVSRGLSCFSASGYAAWRVALSQPQETKRSRS
jgi:hypothetical protein